MTAAEIRKSGKTGPIVLLSDFGTSDPYIGQMKGVIAGIAPDAKIIDLCHGVPAQDIKIASLFLKGSRAFYPENSIFVAVIDPGVGTQRRPILLKNAGQYFIGPDNGLLFPLTAGKRPIEAVQIEHPDYLLSKVSSTFHGRDIFAPAAAYLSKGAAFETFGRPISVLVPLIIPRPRLEGSVLTGEVLHTDRFGNAWTNITRSRLHQTGWIGENVPLNIRIGSYDIDRLSSAYGSGSADRPVALINSFDLVEIAWPGASAVEKLNIRVGTPVAVRGPALETG